MNFSYLKKYYRSDKTAEAIDRLGYDSPTEIQYRAIPHLVSGRDIIGLSQTGTGKTMAFAIPAADLVLASGTGKLQILCVCPTRELAGQVAREMRRLLNNLEGLSVAEVTGIRLGMFTLFVPAVLLLILSIINRGPQTQEKTKTILEGEETICHLP